jgi:hypothetical protein
MKTKILLLSVISLSLSACATGLKLSAEGEKVRVLDPSEVSSCRKLGNTNNAVAWQVVGIARPEDTISKELRVLARNSASRMGGDTIVPLTVIDKGKQTFVVYKCVNPDG